MKKLIVVFIWGLSISPGLAGHGLAPDSGQVRGPIVHVYAQMDTVALKAYVFMPNGLGRAAPRPAIVIFHGGGWTIGEPAWAFGRAEHFARQRMVAVAAQYRLSNQNTITPLEAMADARAVIRWMRTKAATLGLDPDRIAAYGWSAGAHLAASAAIFDAANSKKSVSAAPNALILVSPAVHLENDQWAPRLLGTRANIKAISPAAHVRPGMPPTIILEGSEDTVTPLSGVQLFHDRMRAAGNQCELHIFRGVGHLFTPAGQRDDGWPQPDPKIQAEAFKKIDAFLTARGFIK